MPSLVADLSWTGKQVKRRLTQHLDGTKYVSALIHKDQLIGSDQTLEQAGVGLDGSAEPGGVDFGIVVSEPPNLADVAELPGMSADYKHAHWTSDEIAPDEHDLYQKIAAEIECYFLRPTVPPEDLVVEIGMPQEWTEFYDDYAGRHEGRPPENEVYDPGLVQKMQKHVNRELKTALASFYAGLDRLEFDFDNLLQATARLTIIDGSSSEPIRFADHETSLYMLLVGQAAIGRAEMRISFQFAYLSSAKWCGVHRPRY